MSTPTSCRSNSFFRLPCHRVCGPAKVSHVSSAARPASRHCQKRNPGVPGPKVPSGDGFDKVKLARLAGRFLRLVMTRGPGALDPARGSFGMKLMDIVAPRELSRLETAVHLDA